MDFSGDVADQLSGASENMTWDLGALASDVPGPPKTGEIKMDDGQARDPAKNPARHQKDARAERLKRALRENLKRRKAQARQRKPGEATPSDLDETAFAKDAGEREA